MVETMENDLKQVLTFKDSEVFGHERAKFEGFGNYKYDIKERVNELMELTKKEMPHMDNYLLWLCTLDYIIREELKLDINETEAEEFYKKFQDQKETFIYNNVKIE